MNPTSAIPDLHSIPVVVLVAVLGLLLIGVIASVIHELFADIVTGSLTEPESLDDTHIGMP